MSKSSELRYQRSKYYTLKDNVLNVISYLSNACNSMEPSLKISECFLIDEVSADGDNILNTRNEMINTKSNLSSKVIPAINAKIDSLTIEIRKAEAEEAAEAESSL